MDPTIETAAVTTATTLQENIIGSLLEILGAAAALGAVIFVMGLAMALTSIFLETKYGRRIF